jgi:L-aspartate oxidase
MNVLKTDVLVVGGGAAGIRAAVEASAGGVDVTLVNNARVTASGSTFSSVSRGWGIQALIEGECTAQHVDFFYNEIISVGQGRCDPDLVRILVEESGERIKDLVDYGVRFKKSEDGHFLRAKGCFSESERALLTSDFDNLRNAFLSKLQQHGVRIVTATVIDLVVQEGICSGAFVFDTQDEIIQISAKATVLATGGGAAIYENHLCGTESTGDGYALAIRAGAQLFNMEFIQFMLGLKSGHQHQFLPRHLLYKDNAIIDAAGKPVLERCMPDAAQKENAVRLRENHCPASTCDASFMIDRAIWEAAQKTGAVFWNAEKNPLTVSEVVHMAHAFNGGIRIDATSAASLDGLFAAGEAAAGPHGADRIGGCMMTATQVFGKRAGQYAAEYAGTTRHRALKDHAIDQIPVLKSGGESEGERQRLIWFEQKIKKAMGRHANVVRSKKGLERCRRILSDVGCWLASMEGATRNNYVHYSKVRNMVDVAGQIVESAIRRKISCGAHFRADADTTLQKDDGAFKMECAA